MITSELLELEKEIVIWTDYGGLSAQKPVTVYADCTIAELAERNINNALAIKEQISENLNEAIACEQRAQQLLYDFPTDPSMENWSTRDLIDARRNIKWAIWVESLSNWYVRTSMMYLERIDFEQQSEPPVPGPRILERQQKN